MTYTDKSRLAIQKWRSENREFYNDYSRNSVKKWRDNWLPYTKETRRLCRITLE